MATRQTSRKSPRPVTASPTSKPPRTRTAPEASRRAAGRGEAAGAVAPEAKAAGAGNASKRAADKPAGAARPAVGAPSGSPASRALISVRRALDQRALIPASRALAASVRWSGGGLPFATMLFSLLGLADAVYLTIDHFTHAALAGCAERGAVNCVAVTTSIWSRVPAGTSGGIPVSIAGLAFFVFMVAVNSRWGWRASWPAVHWARLASVVVGMVFVLYLVWAELFRINAICLYCTGVHIITFILFVIIVSHVMMSGVRGIPGIEAKP